MAMPPSKLAKMEPFCSRCKWPAIANAPAKKQIGAIERLDGLKLQTDAFVLERRSLQDTILAETNGDRVMVSGPPASGKTSLIQLMVKRLESEGVKAAHVNVPTPNETSIEYMQKVPFAWLDSLFYFQGGLQNAMQSYQVLFLDDAQGLFPGLNAWNSLVKSTVSSTKMYFFASITPESTENSTPAGLTKKLLWNELRLTEVEQQELVDKMKGYAESWMFPILDLTKNDAEGHVGLLRLMMHHLILTFPGEKEQLKFTKRYYFGPLFDSLVAERIFGSRCRAMEQDHQAIVRRVLFGDEVPAPAVHAEGKSESHEESLKRDLIRMVVLTGITVQRDGQPVELLAFPTAFHRRFFFRNAFPSSISEMDFKLRLVDIDSWIKAVMKKLSPAELTDASYGGSLPREPALQHMFWKAACQCLPSSYRIAAEVSKVHGGSDGSLDFWINSCLNWAIELFVKGDRKTEHINRFLQDGIYYDLNPTDWRLIDFREPGTNIMELKPNAKLISAVFSADYTSITLLFGLAKAPIVVQLGQQSGESRQSGS